MLSQALTTYKYLNLMSLFAVDDLMLLLQIDQKNFLNLLITFRMDDKTVYIHIQNVYLMSVLLAIDVKYTSMKKRPRVQGIIAKET